MSIDGKYKINNSKRFCLNLQSNEFVTAPLQEVELAIQCLKHRFTDKLGNVHTA
jgi:hypothetical protein